MFAPLTAGLAPSAGARETAAVEGRGEEENKVDTTVITAAVVTVVGGVLLALALFLVLGGIPPQSIDRVSEWRRSRCSRRQLL